MKNFYIYLCSNVRELYYSARILDNGIVISLVRLDAKLLFAFVCV